MNELISMVIDGIILCLFLGAVLVWAAVLT